MTPNKILPQANLIIYLDNHVITTLESKRGIIAVITGLTAGDNNLSTSKFLWKNKDLQSFINGLAFNLSFDTTISAITSYNHEDYVLYDRKSEMVKVTRKEIAEKFGTSEEFLEIVF